MDLECHPATAAAAGAVLAYMTETQKDRLDHINEITWYESGAHLILDEVAKRNLELFATIAEGKKSGSLFHVLDETVTSLGGRRLRWWLNHPLRDPAPDPGEAGRRFRDPGGSPPAGDAPRDSEIRL